jgi:catechol 2,3-dioxygenase-like lactoylglutathione lyase family enzyme
MKQPGFIVLYRWRLRPGHETRFKEAWSIVTKALIERGSLGSRLHNGNDGLWYSYAQWPSAEARTAAFATVLNVDDAQRTMDEAVSERFPEIVLTSSVDHLLANPTTPRMRVARPTNDIDRAINFWSQVVGFEILSRFENHDGYDGAILGYPDTEWELEVSHHSSGMPTPAPTEEDILALYLGKDEADEIIDRLRLAGHPQMKHPNPYWQAVGASVYTDPDGYTLIVYPET